MKNCATVNDFPTPLLPTLTFPDGKSATRPHHREKWHGRIAVYYYLSARPTPPVPIFLSSHPDSST